MSMSIPTQRLTLQTPTDLLAAVPYLLGFHPHDSVVVIGLCGTRVVFSVRTDLPPPEHASAVVDQLVGVVAEHGVDFALLIGYGEGQRVTRTVLSLREALIGRGVGVGEVLRAHDGRYWSYLCGSPDCCPADGVPYDASATEVAAAATYAGQVAWVDRAALEYSLASVDGAEREAADQTTELVAAELGADRADRRQVATRVLADAVRCHASGGRISDDQMARLALLTANIAVRDRCWTRIAGSGPALETHVALWTEVTRRARADLVAAPATLLAYAAWRTGNGALARIAVERALATDPRYTLALLLGEALDRALPPSTFDLPRPRKRRRRPARAR